MIDWYEVFVEKRRELEEAEAQVASVERTLTQYQEMLTDAEVRIAAALAVCGQWSGLYHADRIRRVLTGETP